MKPRRALYFVLLLIAHAAAEARSDLQTIIDEFAEKNHIPGLSVAISKGRHVTWQGVVGWADVENARPVTPVTVFRIGSVSKSITAMAVLSLVDSGKVTLDENILQHIPEYNPGIASRIRVRHLLSHQSGIRHYQYDEGEKESKKRFESQRSALTFYDVDQDPLVFEPGKGFLYSTYAYNLLGAIIESATGGSYGDYIREHFFKPAHMNQSALDEPLHLIQHRARSYRIDADGRLSNAPYVDSSFKWSAGGIVSTPTDLLRLHIALEQGRLISPRLRDLAESEQAFSAKRKALYGFGWWITFDERGNKWLGHGGSPTGGSAYLLRSPELELGVAITCNLESVKGLRELAQRLAAAY